MPLGQGAQPAIGAVGDDGPQPRQPAEALAQQLTTDSHIVLLGRIGASADRQPQDVDQQGALGTDRALAPPPAVWGVGPYGSPRTVSTSTIIIDGSARSS